jgi:diadenosine tetraphosphatase ApaH/serine/threonine PP2A family protein phosphatase
LPVAVITDIHSNLPALEAVLDDIDAHGVDRVWCLGDVVGYGADPDACADLVRERCEVCLVGNHDLAVLGALDIAAFSETAAEAVEWTRGKIDERTTEFLAGLDPDGLRDGVALFHASPRDPVWEYVLSLEQAHACMSIQPEPVALIGHSHVSLFFRQPENGGSPADTVGSQADGGSRLDLGEGGRWLINPGSVGQPRDGDPGAAWLELDPEAGTAIFHRLPYDIDRAASAIAEAGLPKRLADRLYVGQ